MILGQDSLLCTWIVNVLVSIKDVEDAIKKCIIWPKKSSKLAKQTWDKPCIDFGLGFKKLNMLVKTR